MRDPDDPARSLRLYPHQRRLIRDIWPPPPAPRPRVCLFSWARKNAKTTTAAIIAAAVLTSPWAWREWIIVAATGSREAATLLRLMRPLIEHLPGLQWRDSVQERSVRTPEGGLMEALPAVAKRIKSPVPTLVIVDEVGDQEDLTVWGALRNSLGHNRRPPIIGIGTRRRVGSPMNVLIDRHAGARNALVSVHSADGIADPMSVEAIERANPGLDYCRDRAEILEAREEARRDPSARADYALDYLNMSTTRLKIRDRAVAGGVAFGPAWAAVAAGPVEIGAAVWWPASRAVFHATWPRAEASALFGHLDAAAADGDWEVVAGVRQRDVIPFCRLAQIEAEPLTPIVSSLVEWELNGGVLAIDRPGELDDGVGGAMTTGRGGTPLLAPPIGVALVLAVHAAAEAPEHLQLELDLARSEWAAREQAAAPA